MGSNIYNSYNLEAIFGLFLKSTGISRVSIKNYLSDLRKFLNWLKNLTVSGDTETLSEESFVIQNFNLSNLTAYKKYLIEITTPEKSLNRSLSALRKFGEFARDQNWLRDNPAKKISNFQTEAKTQAVKKEKNILKEWETDLELENIADATIKNYINDVRQFINWTGISED